MHLICLVIPVHNQKALSLACLENLTTNGNLQKYQVIVVDDCASDRTTKKFAENYPEVNISFKIVL